MLFSVTAFFGVNAAEVTLTSTDLSYDIYTCKLEYEFNVHWRGLLPGSTVTIDFDDGSTASLGTVGATGEGTGSATHLYQSTGSYSVKVLFVDNNSVSSSITAPPETYYAHNSGSAQFSYQESSGVYSFIYEGPDFFSVGEDCHYYTLDLGDGSALIESGLGVSLNYGDLIAQHTYAVPGEYTVTMTHSLCHPSLCTWTYSITITSSGDPCCSNFAPISGERYWVSAWVLEEHAQQVKSYLDARVQIEFIGVSSPTLEFIPTGEIIDGWQRIVGDFVVPTGSTDLKVHLVNNNSSIDCYFDDVRIHPFNASMKSYVYDPETLWLTAELDDNNYATFYEYDNEGQLIRIKKETARGIMTIQESRSSNPKK